jgi:hypothetical protein
MKLAKATSMDHNTAKLLMKNIMEVNDHLNACTLLSDQIADEKEKKEIRRGIGELLGRIYTDIMIPIISQHPDLDPNK